jgi:RNA polymerase sigma-70 factor (ECF subfamily)
MMPEEREPGEDLRRLVEQARDGSEEAFCEIVQIHQARVRTYIGRFIRDPNVVDDLAQNTFLSSFRKLESWRGDASLGTWLLAIAKNEALMHLREERQRREREASPLLSSTLSRWTRERLAAEETSIDAHDTELSALEECLEGLHENSARLIREFYFEGRTAREISEGSGKKEVSVWVTIMRIRRALRACIEARVSSLKIT